MVESCNVGYAGVDLTVYLHKKQGYLTLGVAEETQFDAYVRQGSTNMCTDKVGWVKIERTFGTMQVLGFL